MPIDPGSRDRLVTIKRASSTTTDVGRPLQAFVSIAEVWASKLPISDGERYAGGEIAAEISHRWQIDWTPDVQDVGPSDILVETEDNVARTYEIVGVKEIGRREGLELTTKRRAE